MGNIERQQQEEIDLFRCEDVRRIAPLELSDYVTTFISELEMLTRKTFTEKDSITKLITVKEIADYLQGIKKLISFEDFKRIVKEKIYSEEYQDKLISAQLIISIVNSSLQSPSFRSTLWEEKRKIELQRMREYAVKEVTKTDAEKCEYYFNKFRNNSLNAFEIEYSLYEIYNYCAKKYGEEINGKWYVVDEETIKRVSGEIRKKMEMEFISMRLQESTMSAEKETRMKADMDHKRRRITAGYLVVELFKKLTKINDYEGI